VRELRGEAAISATPEPTLGSTDRGGKRADASAELDGLFVLKLRHGRDFGAYASDGVTTNKLPAF